MNILFTFHAALLRTVHWVTNWSMPRSTGKATVIRGINVGGIFRANATYGGRQTTNHLTLHISAGFRLNGQMKSMDANVGRLTIGRTARMARVGIPTMRFYERAGLLPSPTRSASNYRLYPDEVVTRIRFIRRAQQLGFTLKEIRDLLMLRKNRRISCAEVRSRAQAKIADIQTRIRSLRQMSRALAALADECDIHSESGECPLLKYLESEFSGEEK